MTHEEYKKLRSRLAWEDLAEEIVAEMDAHSNSCHICVKEGNIEQKIIESLQPHLVDLVIETGSELLGIPSEEDDKKFFYNLTDDAELPTSSQDPTMITDILLGKERISDSMAKNIMKNMRDILNKFSHLFDPSDIVPLKYLKKAYELRTLDWSSGDFQYFPMLLEFNFTKLPNLLQEKTLLSIQPSKVSATSIQLTIDGFYPELANSSIYLIGFTKKQFSDLFGFEIADISRDVINNKIKEIIRETIQNKVIDSLDPLFKNNQIALKATIENIDSINDTRTKAIFLLDGYSISKITDPNLTFAVTVFND